MSLALELVAIAGRKILAEIPKSLLRRGLQYFALGGVEEVCGIRLRHGARKRITSKPALKLELEVLLDAG